MYMRLAFSVAVHLEPEILIVDEVLAVGDTKFQQKCLDKMDDVAQQGRTVLFVSHNMATIKRLCERIIWLNQGKIVADGVSEEVIADYVTDSTTSQSECSWPDGISNPGVNEFKLLTIRILNKYGEVTSNYEIGSGFIIETKYRVLERLPYCRVGWLINTMTGIEVMEAYDSDNELYSGPLEPGDFVARCEIPGHLLNAGRYVIAVNAGMPNYKHLAHIENVLSFTITDTRGAGSSIPGETTGVILANLNFQRKKKQKFSKNTLILPPHKIQK